MAEQEGGVTPQRINVAVSPQELAALHAVIELERVSLTEAVRRLVLTGAVVRDALAVGRRVAVQQPDGRWFDLVLPPSDGAVRSDNDPEGGRGG